jgi:Fe-S-cluster containining protein
MGAAKRRRSLIGQAVGTAVDPRSGKQFPTRFGGRLGEFMREKPDPAGVQVPCNGCVACCYHPNVDVEPAHERPEDLAHLDIVQHADGGFALRKREDGACVHLGPSGCTVYAHRPRACRAYDCRLFSVIGLVDHYDGDQIPPAWIFEASSKADRVRELALRLAAGRYISTHPNWTSAQVLAATGEGFREMLPQAGQLVEKADSMSSAERNAIWEASQRALRKEIERDRS